MESVSPQVLTVSQLTLYLKSVIDGDYHFKNILLSGEISNFTRARSGHLYFTLKDESGYPCRHVSVECRPASI